MPERKLASLRQTAAMGMAWPEWLARMDPASRGFTLALLASLAIHAVFLSIHFKLPDAIKRAKDATLEVVLVNSKSARKPAEAQVKAQANLDGGGNTDENRRARTPLPASRQERPGNNLVEAQRRVKQLEIQQQKLLVQARSKKTIQAQVEAARNEPQPEQPGVSGQDLAQSALAIARMEAQIARRIEEYNKRPRRKEIGARAEEYVAAQYLEDWRQKVERIGNLNYPEAAKGRLYGSLLVYVSIKSDGSLETVELRRSSGHRILDEAALRVVRMAAPYANFPAELKGQTDIIGFARTWVFTKADQLRSE